MLTVQQPYILRVIFRKFKKSIRSDKELEIMKTDGTLSTLHFDFEAHYDKLMDKKSRNDQNSKTRDLYDNLCDRTSKGVIEEFFKDECCRLMFLRYWQ